jgi:outer membrane receptor for ferrienterochelin and colicins
VVEAGTSDPVIGAAVQLGERGRGTSTDTNGAFRLNLDASTRLVVSALGYQTQEVDAAPGDTLRVALVPVALRSGEVVVTATRTARERESLPVPVDVITGEEMAARGNVRLSDALAEVPGLTLTDGFGGGVQVQGFSPEYTLILLDGEPIIGRTAGTFDLDRVTIAGIERIEIVKGPSSSLYGSEAMGGVINLVTAAPPLGATADLTARHGTFGRSELTGQAAWAGSGWSVRALSNRSASQGYDLTPNAFGPTVPEFTDWTGDLRGRLDLSPAATLTLGARLAAQDQLGAFALDTQRFDDRARRVDWSVHPELVLRLNRQLRLTTTLYGARYLAQTIHTAQEDRDEVLYDDRFDQVLAKAELQADAVWNARHLTTVGAGIVGERLSGELRYGTDEAPQASQAFAFGQHEWLPSPRLHVTASARLDAHSDYAARLTPKLALLVRPIERLRLRASVGSGFKAPAFRQLYLSFTNAGSGYSVLGSSRLAQGLAELEAQGQLAQVFIDPSQLAEITAESSVAFNVGASADLGSRATVEVSGFWNEVRDLIETQPVAQKTNGQSVFGYFNLAEMYTRGVEAQVTARPTASVDVTAGYQFVQARDRSVVRALEAGTVFGRDADGREYRLALPDYQGLFGRSPHTATLGVTLRSAPATVSLRARWRNRYGFRDLDGNRLANRDDEFVRGYTLLSATVSRSWELRGSVVQLQVGTDNAADVTRGTLVPSMPGRTLFASLGVSL